MYKAEAAVSLLPDEVLGSVRLTDVLRSLPIPIYMTDAEGRITFYNEAAVDFWGRRPDDATRWCGSWKLYLPDGQPIAHEDCPLGVAVRRQVDTRWQRAIAERQDGTRVEFTAFPTLLRNADGRVTGAINALIESNERLRAEHESMRMAAIVESSRDAIISKDLTGIITSWNRGARRLFGYDEAEAVGRSITMLVPPDRLEEEAEILSCIGRGEPIETLNTVRQRKDGSFVAVSETISPVRDRDGRIIGASKIARDITAQKESEERIRLLMREVNHRVKNQYAVILSMIRETNRRSRDPNDFERQVRERIMALSASHDLLVQEDWKGATIFELLLAQLKPFPHEGRVVISGQAVRLLPAAVQYLGIAFHELATNAAKYGALSTSSGRIEVHWEVTEEDDGRRLTLRWVETGVNVSSARVRAGLGTTMLERMAPQAMGGKGEFAVEPGRVCWTLQAPMKDVEARSEPVLPFQFPASA